MTPPPGTTGDGAPGDPREPDGAEGGAVRVDRAGRRAPDYPVVVSLAGRPCLVVGAGPVAARKTRGLVEAGAQVTVVSPGTGPAMDELVQAGSVVLEGRPYRQGEAVSYALVVTATGVPSVDETVVDDARKAGVPVNSADGDRPGTVLLPAVVRRGPVTVAVSTGGTSPALAGWLRDRITASLPPGLPTLAALVDEARSEMQASGRSTDSVDWGGAIDRVVPLVAEDRLDEARTALRAAWDPTAAQPGRPPAGTPG